MSFISINDLQGALQPTTQSLPRTVVPTRKTNPINIGAAPGSLTPVTVGQLPDSSLNAVTDDINVTGVITAQVLVLGWKGQLAPQRLNPYVVMSCTDDTNITGNISDQNLVLGWKNELSVARGGTGTSTPSLRPGTNVTITGTWPNQTINASGGGGGGGGGNYNVVGSTYINVSSAEIGSPATDTFTISLASVISCASLTTTGNIGCGGAVGPSSQPLLVTGNNANLSIGLTNTAAGSKNWQLLSSGTGGAGAVGSLSLYDATDSAIGTQFLANGAGEIILGGIEVGTATGGVLGAGTVNVSTGYYINDNSIYASPALTGTPTAPTASAGTSTEQIATTQFVTTATAGVVGSAYNVIGGTGVTVTSAEVGSPPVDTFTVKLSNTAVTPGSYTLADITVNAQGQITAASNGTSAVTSVFTRTGAVVAASGDYTVAQVTGAAPTASPTFTGTLTAANIAISEAGTSDWLAATVPATSTKLELNPAAGPFTSGNSAVSAGAGIILTGANGSGTINFSDNANLPNTMLIGLGAAASGNGLLMAPVTVFSSQNDTFFQLYNNNGTARSTSYAVFEGLGGDGLILSSAAASGTCGDVILAPNRTVQARAYEAGGVGVGAPTGGSEGVGTVNVATGYYVNGVALGTWTSYSPVLTAGSGTFTTAAATGRYSKIGKTVNLAIEVAITTNGSAATSTIVTLPFTATASDFTYTLSGRENADTGLALIGLVIANATTVTIYGITPSTGCYNAYCGANGYSLSISGTYESST